MITSPIPFHSRALSLRVQKGSLYNEHYSKTNLYNVLGLLKQCPAPVDSAQNTSNCTQYRAIYIRPFLLSMNAKVKNLNYNL